MSNRKIGNLCRSDDSCPEDYVCRKQGLLSRKRCRKRVVRNNTKKRKNGIVRRVGRSIKNKVVGFAKRIKKKIDKAIVLRTLRKLKKKDPATFKKLLDELEKYKKGVENNDRDIIKELERINNMSKKQIHSEIKKVNEHIKTNNGEQEGGEQEGGLFMLVIFGTFVGIAFLVLGTALIRTIIGIASGDYKSEPTVRVHTVGRGWLK